MTSAPLVIAQIIFTRSFVGIWEFNPIRDMSTRDLSRFFDQVGHQTTNASIENKHFFTK